MKKICILIGLKGSGKTHIGKILHNAKIIHFFEIEPIFKKIVGTQNISSFKTEHQKRAYELVKKEIEKRIKKRSSLMIEQSGATKLYKQFCKDLSLIYKVNLIRINSPQKLCFIRTQERNKQNQIPMTEELIKKMNNISLNLKEEYMFEINNTKLSDLEIINIFSKYLIKN